MNARTCHRIAVRVSSLVTMTTFVIAAEAASSQALPENDPVAVAYCGAPAARFDSPWLARSNPASLTAINAPTVTASFAPAVNGIDGYYEGGLLALLPVDSLWRCGGAVTALGVEGYREIDGTVLAGTTIAAVSFGAALHLHSLSINRYGSAFGAALDLGVIARFDKGIRFGGRVANVSGSSMAGTKLPQRIGFGLAFDLDTTTTLSIDAAQELHRSVATSIALSWRPIDAVVLRFGAATSPSGIGFGLGYLADAVTFDYGSAYTAPLGLRHAVGVALGF